MLRVLTALAVMLSPVSAWAGDLPASAVSGPVQGAEPCEAGQQACHAPADDLAFLEPGGAAGQDVLGLSSAQTAWLFAGSASTLAIIIGFAATGENGDAPTNTAGDDDGGSAPSTGTN